ncbi:MAG: 50S ribosomal protein L21 [bacterium]
MTEFAIIATGGKQYPVSVGDVVRVETLPGDLKKGDKVVFDQVLLVDNGKDTSVGTPTIKGATVEGIFQTAGRGKKVLVVKYKAKSKYHKKNGHRQEYSEVKISAIK